MEGSPVLRIQQTLEVAGFPAQTVHFIFDPGGATQALGAEVPDLSAEVETIEEEAPSSPEPRRPPPRMMETSRQESTLLVLYETRADGWSTAEAVRGATGWPIIIQRLDGSARQRLLEGKVCMVVVDVGEHKERGITACRRLVRLINGASIPVYICAPSWRREEVQRAIRAGVGGILVKPLDAERIESVIPSFAAEEVPEDAAV